MSTAGQQSAPGSTDDAWQEFRARRDRGLAAPHGILSQIALHWLDADAGPQSFDGIPGTWQIEEGELVVTGEVGGFSLLVGAPDVEVEGQGGQERAVVKAPGDVRLARFGDEVHIDVIRRGGRTGLRILDPSAPRRTGFTTVPTHPYDPALVVTGTWTAQPAEVTVGSALPWLEQQLSSPGVATLEIDGQQIDLVLTGESSILFTDDTSGDTSADWRVVPAEFDGSSVRVDFNRAVNFPAAFSAWATCPRPPAGNHVPLPVRAGEQRVDQTER